MSKIETRVKELVYQTWDYPPEDLLRAVLNEFKGKIALSSSLGAEDQVLTHMLCEMTDSPTVFTLDTGRLPQETYDVLDKTRQRYGIEIEVLFPDAQEVQDMVKTSGANLFYKSIELRKQCCFVRKMQPLKKRLALLDAWVCGLRSEQLGQTRPCWYDHRSFLSSKAVGIYIVCFYNDLKCKWCFCLFLKEFQGRAQSVISIFNFCDKPWLPISDNNKVHFSLTLIS